MPQSKQITSKSVFKTTQKYRYGLQKSNTFSLIRIAKKYRGWKYNFEF